MHIETSAKNDTNVKSLFHEIGTYGLSIKAHISGGVAQKLPSHAPQSDREAFPLIPCVPTRVDVFLAWISYYPASGPSVPKPRRAANVNLFERNP